MDQSGEVPAQPPCAAERRHGERLHQGGAVNFVHRIAAALAIAGLLVGCEYTGPRQAWTESAVKGLHISLIHADDVEDLAFLPSGDVIVTFGTRSAITAPIMKWKIVDGRLVIFDDSGTLDTLTLISRSDVIHAASKRFGDDARYKIRQD
jgi:hypothetical protein